VDAAGSRLRIKRMQTPPDFKELENEIARVQQSKKEAVESQRFEEAGKLRDQEKALLEQKSAKEAEIKSSGVDLFDEVDEEAIATAQKAFSRFDSVGQQRMSQLHGGRKDKLEVSPNLWAGVGLVRGGAGTALVGSPQQVADRMKEYMALGIDRFILSGYPHLEECYRFAELVFPLLPLKKTTGVDLGAARNAGPFGEVIANVVAPSRMKVASSG